MDRKLKVGFIGCGGISRLYTDIYAGMTDLAQVVATADLYPKLAEDRAEAIHEAYTAEAARQRALAINARDEESREAARQMAVLTTPPIRGVPVVAAARAGKHVFTEGPMAKSVQEADEILAAVEEAGVTYASQCGGRYTRGLQHARRAIGSGLMGPLAVAKIEINWYHQQSYYMGGWHGKFDTEGGGAVFHHGRYVIEPFLFALGSPIVEVTAYSGGFLREIEHDSYSLALVRYANGAVGIVQGSLLHHEHPRTEQTRWEFVGQNASMVVTHEHLGWGQPTILLKPWAKGWRTSRRPPASCIRAVSGPAAFLRVGRSRSPRPSRGSTSNLLAPSTSPPPRLQRFNCRSTATIPITASKAGFPVPTGCRACLLTNGALLARANCEAICESPSSRPSSFSNRVRCG